MTDGPVPGSLEDILGVWDAQGGSRLNRDEAQLLVDEIKRLRAVKVHDGLGVFYCPVHFGVANEDSDDCDFRARSDEVDEEGEPLECDFKPVVWLERDL